MTAKSSMQQMLQRLLARVRDHQRLAELLQRVPYGQRGPLIVVDDEDLRLRRGRSGDDEGGRSSDGGHFATWLCVLTIWPVAEREGYDIGRR